MKKSILLPYLLFMQLLIMSSAIYSDEAENETLIDFTTQQAYGSLFVEYNINSFTVSSLLGDWIFNEYGNPSSSITFVNPNGLTLVTGEIKIVNSESSFKFHSIDLYSSVTRIPYRFSGYLDGKLIYTENGEVPNTFGAFKSVENSYLDQEIDTLYISLINPTTIGCSSPAGPFCSNPMGVDNILLSKANPINSQSDSSLPELAPAAINLQDSVFAAIETTAKFSGGIALNYSDYQRFLTQPAIQDDTITLSGVIIPDAKHAGQQAEIIVVGAVQEIAPDTVVTAPDDCNLQEGTWIWYMNTKRDNLYCNWSELPGQQRYCNSPKSASEQSYWQLWKGNPYELAALDSVILEKDTTINLTVNGRGPLYRDIIDYHNKHVCVNFGYRLKDGTIVFNVDTINFRVN